MPLYQAHRRGPLIPAKVYGNPSNVAVGAMRWDGVYGDSTILAAENGYLGPDKFHFRAPWWSVAGSDTIELQGDQDTMNAEIDIAVASGLDHWVFFYYASSSEMSNGWDFFQASPKRDLMKYCLAFSSYNFFNTSVTTDLTATINLLKQTNYKLVLTNRPLVYIYDDNNGTSSATNVTDFRAACISEGLGSPYIIGLHDSDPVAGAVIKTANGLDAISSYAYQANEVSSYDVLRKRAEVYWPTLLAASEMVPICMAGWHTEPRGGAGRYAYALPWQLSDHIQNAINYSAANSPAKVVLIYAWNEHSEGGWLCPTWVDGTIDNANFDYVNALALIYGNTVGPSDVEPPGDNFTGTYLSQGIF